MFLKYKLVKGLPGDWRILLHYFAFVLYLLSFSLVVPVVVSVIVGENILFIIVLLAELFALYITSYFLSKITTPGEIGFVDALVLTALTFLVGGIVAGIPIIVYDEPLNAFFEGVSAITTTGLSSLQGCALTPGVQFLRAYFQWIGGLGIALLTVSFLLSPGSAAYNIYAAHLGKVKIKPLSLSTVRVLLKIYLGLTTVYMVMYMVSGLGAFDSLINSLTTISTGGFSTLNTFSTPRLLAAGILGMFISAQPMILYYYLYRGNLRRMLRENQVYSFIFLLALGLTLLLATDRVGVERGLFQIASALSTTGYTSLENRTLSDGGKMVLSIMMIIGAGLGSTGGGLKQLRLIILVKSFVHNIRSRLLPPNAIRPLKVNGTTVGFDDLISVLVLLLLYLITLTASTWLFTLHGYTLADSLFESSSALATTGLSVGLSGPGLAPDLKLLLIMDMLLGRVEIIPFIYLIIYPLRGRS